MRSALVAILFLPVFFLPGALRADLSEARFQACSSAVASLTRHGEFLNTKLRSGFASCQVVRHNESSCDWDDPAGSGSNASCRECAELVKNQESWLAMLEELQVRVTTSCGYSIGLSVAGG